MASTAQDEELARLERAIDACMLIDRARMRRAVGALRTGQMAAAHRDRELGRVASAIAQSQARRAERLARLPAVECVADLPIAARRAEIAAAICAHPVTIVCGETGSGKTTQLPKICLQLGRGVDGAIGHTQPRRIAARTVATRIAQEIGTPLGEAVGYKVRFQDKVGPGAFVKVMTDGILLAETQSDRLLAAYDTLIIDEAHERSLNIDFLLGYVHGLLSERPDLKLIITSATIDAARFSQHFGGAPVIEVSGRLYPVEIRHLEPQPDDAQEEEPDIATAIVDAIDRAARIGPGHVLVFLPGEREIREIAEALRKHHPQHTEILPLYARLSVQEQERVFEPTNRRRIVLATNVAETSLTVPGIRFVIDPGLARVNRYSYRNKVEQLVTEKISQASANQRAGRCGRVMSGICFRLYSREDYAERPQFGDPELLRSSLAGVILRMKYLDLGAVERFPFIDPPQPRMIADGYRLLAELGAVDEERALTALGRELSRLPIDPRLGRMLIEARGQGCLEEVLIVAAALAVQDPRDRPLERAQAADDRQAPFRDERSDFLGLIKLWRFYGELLRHKKSQRKLAQELRSHFLSPARMREWHEVHAQLRGIAGESGYLVNQTQSSYQQLHRALLAGLLGNIGAKSEQGDYEGARGIRFVLHPGSGIRKRAPQWVMAAELVETARLYARTAAQIEPSWIEQAAPHLVKRSWFEAHWDKERAQPMVWEQVSLYGLTIIPRRRVPYAPIDPVHARDIFIRAGLIEGGYQPDAEFVRHNLKLRRELVELENKSRRRDVLVDEQTMHGFFDARLPSTVTTARAFESWRTQAESRDARILFMGRADMMRPGTEHVNADLYPDTLELEGSKLRLRYRFDPGHPLDGVTATVPLHALNKLDADRFTWLVPGLLRDKVNALARSLPKSLRRELLPIAETVTACLEVLEPGEHGTSLFSALAAVLKRVRNIDVPAGHFSDELVPVHLRMNFRVVDDRGAELGGSRDLGALQDELGLQAQAQFAPQTKWERPGLKSWDEGLTLPDSVDFKRGGDRVTGHPALLDEQDSVRLTLVETAAKAREASRQGVNRLVRLELKEQMRALERAFKPDRQLVLKYAPYGKPEQLVESLLRAAIGRAVWTDESPLRNRAEFDARLKQVRARLQIVAAEYLRLVTQILDAAHAVRQLLASKRVQSFRHAVDDIGAQLAQLIYPGFVDAVPYVQLQQFPRYLQAIERRIEKLGELEDRDWHHTRELARWRERLAARLERDRRRGVVDPSLAQFRWMLEEQRVSLFAQELKTAFPISYKRLERAWAALDGTRADDKARVAG